MSTHKVTIWERWLTFIRFLQILGVVFSEWLAFLFRREPIQEHLYRVVVRLGPTFIKLGQVASTRPDLVSPEISERFKELQENVPPFSFEAAVALVEAELGKPLDEAFTLFAREPIASASLSQVYFAALPDETPVAVKVQRPGIRQLIERDLAILQGLAWLAERFSPVMRALRLTVAVREFGRWTLKELDFEIEGHNADAFRENFASWEDVVFPKVYWSHTTPRVLTMQRVSGVRVGDVPGKFGPVFSRRLATRLAEMEMKMFITDAFFHADLHPGNIFFQPDGSMAVLDVGMVGQMTSQQRDRFLAYWIAITRRQRDRAFHHLIQMAELTDRANVDGFRISYDVSLDRFYNSDLSERSLAQTYLEIVLNGARFGIVFPPEMVMQAKAVVTAEALDLVLVPDFRFADEVRPIVARELARRAAPRRLLDHLWDGLPEWVLLGEDAPARKPSTEVLPDEAAFRRQAKTALAETWFDALDDGLRHLQRNLPRYTSPGYWMEHPERLALLETTIGLIRLLANAFSRAQQESHIVTGNTHTGSSRGMPFSPNGAQERRAAFIRDNLEQATVRNEYVQVFEYLRELVGQYADPDFWEERSVDKAALMSALTVLRFWVAQLGQVVNEGTQHDA